MEETYNKDFFSNIQFTPVKIGGYECNANGRIYKFNDFSQAIPNYTEQCGLHLDLSPESNEIIPLKSTVVNSVLIKDNEKMSDEEFLQEVATRKKAIIDYLVRMTYQKGYKTPSPVQTISIPYLIQRRDAVIQFKSGTGKTHAFLFGLLANFDPEDDELQYIFITTSHEVADQIYIQAKDLVPETTRVALCIGRKIQSTNTGGFKKRLGTTTLNQRPMTMKQEREVTSSAQIIVGTIGKIYDFMCNSAPDRKPCINTKYLKGICLDEFDNIVCSRSRSSSVMGTDEQVEKIFSIIPRSTQRAFFSATITEESLMKVERYLRKYDPQVGDPFVLLLNPDDSTLEGIRQYYVVVQTVNDKKDVLIDILRNCRISQCIIFTNKIETANMLKDFLAQLQVPINSSVFHSGLSSVERKNLHNDFLKGNIRYLISSDVAARGLDIHGINLVINYDMPDYLETYVHRVGRSGRFGRIGVAISLIFNNELKNIEQIRECSLNSKIDIITDDLANLL